MSPSRFLSITSVVGALGASCLVAGCSGGGGTCGPGSASDSLAFTAGTATLTYGPLSAGANNDCSETGSGIVSITITGMQSDGSGILAICVPRPDKLSGGLSLATGVQLVNVDGSSAGCTYSLDGTTAPTGTVTGKGVCKNGSASEGFAMTVNGTISLQRTCGSTVDTVAAKVDGTVAVAGP